MQRVKVTAIVLVAVTILSCSATAYEVPGHYYTITLLMKNLLPLRLSEQQSSLVAFCAQLPDIAEELDAVEVYKSAASNPIAWAAWGSRDKVWNKNVAQMVAVQQFLHGLTGGTTEGVQTVAREIIRELSYQIWQSDGGPPSGNTSALCALGFAMHLYGDSFAHRQINKPESMYPTGRGHAGHGHEPDRPLSSSFRTQDWGNYLVKASGYLGNFTLDPNVQTQEVNEVKKLQADGKATWFNRYGEDLLWPILIQRIDKSRLEQFNPPMHKQKTSRCQDYINKVFNDGHFKGLGKPQCEVVWSRFRDKAKSNFERYPDAIAPQWRNLKRDDPQF